MKECKTMKSIKTVLATLAVMVWAGSAVATMTQTIWVNDNGGGLSTTPATSASGVVVYSSSDTFWTVVISTGTASPPASGQGTTFAPVMDLNVQAISSAINSVDSHPLTITFGADGYGPTVGQFLAIMSGHLVSGTAHAVTYNTYYDVSPIVSPPGTLLTASGPLVSSFNGSWTSSVVSLASPYSLEEVITIQASPTEAASYSLDGSISLVPEPTTMIAGALLLIPFGLQGIRCLRSRKLIA
jgi:hypothetical protein